MTKCDRRISKMDTTAVRHCLTWALEQTWLDEPTKRRRRSYTLTEAGRLRMAQQIEAWGGFFARFFAVIEEAEP